MIILHDCTPSGNAYKIRLLLTQLGLEFEKIEYDVTKGDTRTPEYLANVSPFGKVPAVQFDGKTLTESNAILFYFASGTKLYPTDLFEQAQVMQWFGFEQYDHEPAIAVAKFILTLLPEDSPRRADIPSLHEKGYKALSRMEDHLSNNDYFVGGTYSIADISLYAYTSKADLGGFDLTSYPSVLKWMARIETQENYFPMF